MTPTRTGRRAAAAAIAAALIATLTLTGAVAAKDHPNKPEKAHPVKSGQTQGGGGGAKPAALEKPASLRVKGNASHPGSVFRVNAVLKSARDARPETMQAVVHFATGDVVVELVRQGGGAAYHAWVPVPEDEPEGIVLIDATAQVDGETVEATGAGKILDRGSGADAEPDALEQPEASPQTCEPEPTPEPTPSDEPEPSPTASTEPEPSPTESAAPSPTGSAEADPSDAGESPEPTASPDAEETADDECPDGEGGTAQLTAAVLARIIAYIEALLA